MKWVASLTFIFLVSTGFEAKSETLSDALKQCSQVSNSLKRLVCYDKLVLRADGLQNSDLPELRQEHQANRPASTGTGKPYRSGADNMTQEQAFGMEEKMEQQRREEVSSISSFVVSVKKDAFNKRKITLDNGQVWQEMEASRLTLKQGDQVTVERGMLGSFYLTKKGSNRQSRVKRSK